MDSNIKYLEKRIIRDFIIDNMSLSKINVIKLYDYYDKDYEYINYKIADEKGNHDLFFF